MDTGTRSLEPASPVRSGNGGSEWSDDLKEKASELTHGAQDKAFAAIDDNKEQLCALLDRVADTVKDDRIGRYAASYARRGADYLRSTSSQELLSTARDSVGARPALAIGACFAAGLALARILRR